MSYVPRIVDDELQRALKSAGAVLIQGARAIGKTETAKQQAASILRLDTADPRAVLARQDPSLALDGDTPRLLDEYQAAPGLWNAVRHEVDGRGLPGQFILTGSAVPTLDGIQHSGAGRVRRILMRTMTLQETGHSTGRVSLSKLLLGEEPGVEESEISLPELLERLVIGGWPGQLTLPLSEARATHLSYVSDLATHDFIEIGGARRDPRRMEAFLRAVAGLVSQNATFAGITRRMRETETLTFGDKAVSELFDLAAQMFVVEDQEAWSPRLTSASAPSQTPVRHLADVSLACALLGAGVDRLLAEPATLGYIFESAVVHDLRVYADAAQARGVYHYRDTKGRDEIDAIVEGIDGQWLGIEVKLGQSACDEAAANLLRVAAKVARPPQALAVIIPTGIAHRRSDGVYVIPLSTLGV